jgi:hypothetical protein
VNESESKTKPNPKTFTESYRSSVRCAVVWALVLTLWCGLVLDMGESAFTLLYSLGGYLALILLVMVRRPSSPTPLDLVLVGWSLPIIFFAGLFLYPLTLRF